MKLQELTRFVKSGDVGSILLLRCPNDESWEVWAYDFTDARTLGPWGNRLTTERHGEPKTYTSIDRAYAALRKLGYAGTITIEG